MSTQIEDWRAEIDAIDAELLRLLNVRTRLALEIGTLKRMDNLPVLDPAREARILERACTTNSGPLDAAAVTRLFRRIICETRRIEERSVREAGVSSNGVLR